MCLSRKESDMGLHSRLKRLERRLGPVSKYPTIVCLDVPGGQPDMIGINGQWQPVPDGRALLRELAGLPVTVIGGIDPLVVTGEKPGLRLQRRVC
jgi:hypothetical protein